MFTVAVSVLLLWSPVRAQWLYSVQSSKTLSSLWDLFCELSSCICNQDCTHSFDSASGWPVMLAWRCNGGIRILSYVWQEWLLLVLTFPCWFVLHGSNTKSWRRHDLTILKSNRRLLTSVDAVALQFDNRAYFVRLVLSAVAATVCPLGNGGGMVRCFNGSWSSCWVQVKLAQKLTIAYY